MKKDDFPITIEERWRGAQGMAEFLLAFLNRREAELQSQIEKLRSCVECPTLPNVSYDGDAAARAAQKQSVQDLMNGVGWSADKHVTGHHAMLRCVRAWEKLADFYPDFIQRTPNGYHVIDPEGDYEVTILDRLNPPVPLAQVVDGIKAEALAESEALRRKGRLN